MFRLGYKDCKNMFDVCFSRNIKQLKNADTLPYQCRANLIEGNFSVLVNSVQPFACRSKTFDVSHFVKLL